MTRSWPDTTEPPDQCRLCLAKPNDEGDWPNGEPFEPDDLCPACIAAETAEDLQAHCVKCGCQPVDEADLDEWADMRRRPTCPECLAARLLPKGVRMAG